LAVAAAACVALLGAAAGREARKLVSWVDPSPAGSLERSEGAPPSAFSFLDAFAEPSREVLVLDAAVRARSSADRPCENPYGCDR
jgi:hypothetical protein